MELGLKGGHTPIHIMRFAPSDYVNDPFVRALYMKRDYRTAAFYPVFLFYCHMEGGDVSSNVEQLAPLVLMKVSDVAHALAVCVEAGKITEENGRLFHRRVRRQVLDELRYRRQQSKLGKKGGRPRASIDKEGKPKGSLLDNQSPPSPSPAPSPLPAPTPSPERTAGPTDRPRPTGDGPKRNPLIDDREKWERESMTLTREIGDLRTARLHGGGTLAPDEPTDGAEIFVAAAKYEGALRQKCNPANMTDDRLLNTVLDLRAVVAVEREKAGKVRASA